MSDLLSAISADPLSAVVLLLGTVAAAGFVLSVVDRLRPTTTADRIAFRDAMHDALLIARWSPVEDRGDGPAVSGVTVSENVAHALLHATDAGWVEWGPWDTWDTTTVASITAAGRDALLALDADPDGRVTWDAAIRATVAHRAERADRDEVA